MLEKTATPYNLQESLDSIRIEESEIGRGGAIKIKKERRPRIK
jgi:hypothetical protein